MITLCSPFAIDKAKTSKHVDRGKVGGSSSLLLEKREEGREQESEKEKDREREREREEEKREEKRKSQPYRQCSSTKPYLQLSSWRGHYMAVCSSLSSLQRAPICQLLVHQGLVAERSEKLAVCVGPEDSFTSRSRAKRMGQGQPPPLNSDKERTQPCSQLRKVGQPHFH